MKRTPLKQKDRLRRAKKPLARTVIRRTSRVNPVNKERRARVNATTFGPQAVLCRTLPCCVCHRPGPSDPAHVRSRGAGGKDRANVVPMCRFHHSEQGAIGIRTFQAKYGISMEAIAAALEKVAYPVSEAPSRLEP